MLKSLEIKNYAIIDEIYIRFDKQINIITGETGAGKSIILGALGLITGERADMQILSNRDLKCTIEAVFDISDYNLKSFFDENDLEFEMETVIRREIQPSGKSRAFVNDTPVNLNILKNLTDYLIEINSQNQSLELRSNEFQLNIVDAFAENESILMEYKSIYTDKKKLQRELNETLEDTAKLTTELDYLQFQFNELSNANLESIHQHELEQELQTLENAEEIKLVLNGLLDLLENGEMNIIDSLNSSSNALHKVTKYNENLQKIAEHFDAVRFDLKEVCREIEVVEQQIEHDGAKILEIQEVLNLLYKLQKKHFVSDVPALIAIRDQTETRLQSIKFSTERIEPLKAAIEKCQISLLEKASKLSNKRLKIAGTIEQKVLDYLNQLGMSNAQFKISINTDPEKLNSYGYDEVKFLFSANKGSSLQELSKAISGGEMSRFMLSLKSVLAEKMSMPTLIFDEIDTGVSGDIAFKVGELLYKLSNQHQLIAITHLPQIAAKGKHHLFVYKVNEDNKTNTHIKLLNDQERSLEIAKMLSGEKVTEIAITNARELLNQK